MQSPITKKKLIDWAGPQVLRDAEVLLEKDLVLKAEYDPPSIHGSILWNNHELNTSMEILPDGNVENNCPCYTNMERGLICAHVIALGLAIVRRQADPLREVKYQEEMRRASRLAEVDETAYITRVPETTAGARPAKLVLTLDPDWEDGIDNDQIPMSAALLYRKESLPLDQVPTDIPFSLSRQDESILFVLEDICQGPATGSFSVNAFDFVNLISLQRGRPLPVSGAEPVQVNEAPMRTHVRMRLDADNGELVLDAHTELPFLEQDEPPRYIIAGKTGWAYGANNLWPLENLLPAPYHDIYRGTVRIARPDVLRFLDHELPVLARDARIESDLSRDLFTVDPASPHFRLAIKGSPASLSAVLHAEYNGWSLVAGRPDANEHFGIPDPEDLLRYTVRNPDAEKGALIRLRPTGFSGERGDALSDIVGTRQVLNFLASQLPALRRKGWSVTLEGRVSAQLESCEFVTPVVHVTDDPGGNWFDVSFDFEDQQGDSLSNADIQEAIRKGDAFIQRKGRTVLIDADAVQAMQGVFADCATGESNAPGTFRMSTIYAPFVKSSLDALDGIDVEDSPSWRVRAEQFNRQADIKPVVLPPPLDTTLRPYQADGVNWLRFLEANKFCGLLADEMGLGKTLQTLTWLQLPREAGKEHCPALVVCPTSLVENWAEEAAKFTPNMRSLILTGADRRDRWDDITNCDLAITSYAILRRDIERYVDIHFSAVILDEAQHIKNRSTQNAVAAKQLQTDHRLVLTGTPIENSVSDLWSIMDFLMPGYLGGHQAFRQDYELPISRGKQEADFAQTRLRRKLHPFLLRRLKTDVAKDLPAKIEKISSCTMTADQRKVYTELLEASRRKIGDLVASKGFNKCRMEILTTLMRLRQVCCHLDLLKLPELDSKYPSAKLDVFFELLDEAMDGGHRILVFSQFVSMLTILRNELEKRDVSYCYLDGSTKDRQKEVKTFNTQRDIPLFLISLKAGGTGLNLTGADMVIHFDPWWNPAVEDQATDRAHRIGQNRTVYSIKLITRDTVEEKVLAMQQRKKAVINATIESMEQLPVSMDWEDIQEILEL